MVTRPGAALFHRRYDYEHGLIRIASMTISQAQLRTLNLLDKKPACRVYRSDRADDYSWMHDDTHVRLTATLHRLFSSGYAMLSPENRNVAVLTEKGREMVAVRGGC
jgi:hypothetical protein